MSIQESLKNFPARSALYLKKLSQNNNREWFEANRDIYNTDFLEPAIQFVVEMGERLLRLSPDIHAIPKIDKSIFRIHRDVRFSKNKEPYKTNMGLYFWEGPGKKMEGSGYYFHLEPKRFGVGAGMYMFTKDHIKKFRDTIADSAKGKELSSIVKKITKSCLYSINGKNFKKTPRGYDPDSKYAEFFLYNGIYSWYDGQNFNELKRGNPVDIVFRKFKDMAPLHKWLVKNILS
jgi:uncharacterized protein (TIGR02453 family)